MMAIAYTKEMRERAKAEDKFLIQVSFDLWRWHSKWQKKNAAKREEK